MDSYTDLVAGLVADIGPLPWLDLPIADAIGCRAIDDVVVVDPVPNYRDVRIEGYALRAQDIVGARADLPVTLALTDSVTAGFSASEPVGAGHAVRVAPGAPMPEGADTVAPVTVASADGDKVQIMGPVPQGQGFHPAGRIFAPGRIVLRAGERLTHQSVAALALLGRGRVRVHPRPRVVVVVVGSELVPFNAPGAEGLMHDAAGILLASTARGLGADAYRVGPVPDEERAARDAVEDQLVRADLLVTVGGIDTPDDTLRQFLEDSGTVRFDGPPLQPCPVYGAGLIGPDNTPLIALPGDPAVALLAFHALARPVIDAMRGVDPAAPIAPRAEGLPTQLSDARLIPGRHNGDGSFSAIHASAPTLADIAEANAMVVAVPGGGGSAPILDWPT